jgi:hypothetical protein
MKNETIIKNIDIIIKNNDPNKSIILKLMLDNECKKEKIDISIIAKLLNEKVIPDQNTMDSLTIKWKRKCAFCDTIEIREQIADMLMKYGYIPTKNDIFNLASIGGEFKNIPENYFNDINFVKDFKKRSITRNKFLYKKYFPLYNIHEYLKNQNMNFYGVNIDSIKIKEIIKKNR